MGDTPKKLLDLLYNKKLPQVYREEDSKIGYPLKRYLESLIEGGYKGAIADIEKILTLFDPNTVSDSLLPFLCESFGLEYFPDIEAKYQRKFVMNFGELVRRRGTFASVRYMIRALTGLESDLSKEGDTLNIVLLAANIEQINNMEISMVVVDNYIRSQIPYFVTPHITSRVATQVIPSSSYSLSAVTVLKSYQISKKEET